MFRRLYLRFKYRKQLRLAANHFTSKQTMNFARLNDSLYVMNGVDPIVRVDLSRNVAIAYTPPQPNYFNITADAKKRLLSDV